MRRLTTTIACYGLLIFAGAAPLDVSALLSQRGSPQAAAAMTDNAMSQDRSVLPDAKRIAATHDQADLD